MEEKITVDFNSIFGATDHPRSGWLGFFRHIGRKKQRHGTRVCVRIIFIGLSPLQNIGAQTFFCLSGLHILRPDIP